MQLTSQGQSRAMVVEFRPHNILTDKFVYTLKFMGDEQTKSMRLMSKKEMILALKIMALEQLLKTHKLNSIKYLPLVNTGLLVTFTSV